MSWSGWEWTLEYRRSLYDLAIPVRPRAAKRALARGANPIVFGLPSWHVETEVSYAGWPMAAPFAGFGYTAYKVAQPASRSYTLGVRAAWKALRLAPSYELYDAGGGSSNIGYWSLSLGVEF